MKLYFFKNRTGQRDAQDWETRGGRLRLWYDQRVALEDIEVLKDVKQDATTRGSW